MSQSLPNIVTSKDFRRKPSFLDLPGEIRNQIYVHLLVSKAPKLTTYGPGSGIETAILRTNHMVHMEAVEFLNREKHILRCDGLPDRVRGSEDRAAPTNIPVQALGRLHHVTLQIMYETSVRGDCEIEILRHFGLLYFTEAVAFGLRRSNMLETLSIELLNNSQRGRGQRRLRSAKVRQTMHEILLPFAYLPSSSVIELIGFDTLDYAEMFEQMRLEYAGTDRSYPDLLDKVLKIDKS